METSLRKQCARRWEALKNERSTWMPHWEEISEVLLPRAGRFLVSDNNKGDKRHRAILDNSGTRALRTLSGGMMAGMTSPARPWFRLTTKDPKLDEAYAVKEWSSKVTSLMQMVFNQSNTYRALQMAYEELGAFGTAAVVLLDDFDSVIHCMPLTIGEFALATDARGNVNTLYREFRLTVSALVREFGYNNVSPAVRRMYDKGQYDKWVDVVNAIEPRTYRDPEKHDAMNMPYRSVYFESRNWDRYDGVLRESGFRQFPVLAARWNVTGGDIYGTGPGMEALGDLRQLQQEQFYKSKAIAMQADPAVVASADMRNQEANLVPGGVIYADNVAQVQGIRAAYEVNLRLDYLVQDLQDTRRRIDEAFYKDIFLMITGMPASQRATATEIAERHEEKMLMLGPVLERLNAELNDRLISMTFDRLLQVGLIPPVPQELEGVDLNVEFVSVLAQAQKAITTNAVDRFTQNLGQLANMKPEILDKFDADYWADYYSDVLGLDPRLIVPGKEVARIRQQRAEAQQQAQQLANAEQASAIAKNLGAAQQGQPIQGELRSAEPGEIYNQFSGY
ncbi:portal protein [Parasutterella excrementihominis]|uniref:portal protein n=1 Tax=Parasutterella excrementihominis TaxID=487175 RepID=UPI00243305A3|nr:portal protein [Parasutterella excrementihominis]